MKTQEEKTPLKDWWPAYRSMIKSFYVAVEQVKKKDGSSPYATGWNDAIKAMEAASELWFQNMDKVA